ncbi:major facilitator family sugar transporter [Acidocella aminolytica 101 = DSM 11237]|nr:major facilitator family sugar transporter [Acidocella aminolytica 101 = DSM 11237]
MIIDRIGRRKLLIGSLIAYPVFGTAPLYLSNLTDIIISRLGVGVAETVLMSASITMLGDFFTDLEREKFLAMNTGIASLSATAFFAIGGALASHNWRMPYAVYALAVVFLLAVLAFTWEPERHHSRRELDEAVMAAGPFPFFRLLAICVVTIAGGIVFMLPQIEIGVISAAHGFKSPATAGMIGAIGSVAMPVGAFTFNQLRKRNVKVQSLVVLAFVLGGAGLITMAAMSTLPLLTLGMIIHEFGCGFMLTGLMTWVLGLLTYEYRGKGTGAYFSSFFIAQPISGFLFGVVQRALGGSPLTAFYAFGGSAILLAVLLAIIQGMVSADRSKAVNTI